MQEERRSVKPLVSVIIATRNYGAYIAEAIESVLAQTYSTLELIIVDDGSTDNTKDIVKQYPQAKYFYQTHTGPKTPSGARNKGVAISKGEFIVCLDADDKLDSHYIYECLAAITKNKHIGFVWTASQQFGELLATRYPRVFHHRLSALRGAGGQLGAALIRRKAFDDVGGYDVTIEGLEDWDLVIRICLKGWKAVSIAKPLHYARVHKGQQTSLVVQHGLERCIERKYPIMRWYVPLSRLFDAVVLFLTRPKVLSIRLRNRICDCFNMEQLPEL